MRIKTGVRFLPLAALLLPILVQCQKNPTSATLSLSLTAGMERSTHMSTEISMRGKTGASDSYVLSLTYKFRVLSVNNAGTLKIEYSVPEADATKGFPNGEEYLKSLRDKPMVLTMDKNGNILDTGAQISPLFPGLPSGSNPAQGDMGSMFGGLNGKTIGVGETWTSEIPMSGAVSPSGTVTWTLSSLTRTSLTLSYTGDMAYKEIPFLKLLNDARAKLTGTMSGFVVLDSATGWPRQGRTVLKADASLTSTDERILSITVTTRFDEVR